MSRDHQARSSDELRGRLRPFCEKHHILRLEVFGSAARNQIGPDSDVDLLVTFDESVPVSTGDLLEMAGEAEELIGRPVDFVLRPSLEKSQNRFAREHILATAVCLYGKLTNWAGCAISWRPRGASLLTVLAPCRLSRCTSRSGLCLRWRRLEKSALR